MLPAGRDGSASCGGGHRLRDGWGQLTELRVRDFDFDAHLVTVSRAVLQSIPEDHPTGGRFLAQEYPKDQEFRRFGSAHRASTSVKSWLAVHGLEPSDLLFATPEPAATPPDPPRPGDLGLTESNPEGRQYRHGTLTGY